MSFLWVGTRSWSRYMYVQMCTSYLTIERTTLVGAVKTCFRTLVYEHTRNTRNFNPNPNPNPNNPNRNHNPNGKLFESDYWHASCPLYCKPADAHLYISRPWSSGDHFCGMAVLEKKNVKKKCWAKHASADVGGRWNIIYFTKYIF